MRPVLTFLLILLLLAAGVVPSAGAHPVKTNARKACCEAPRRATDCGGKRRPMPCCTIRPAPASTSDLPPAFVRAEAPAQAHLDQTSSPETIQLSGRVSVQAHILGPKSDPPKLYCLYASYLI